MLVPEAEQRKKVTDPSALAVYINNPDGFTRNIVFQEVLWLYMYTSYNHEISVLPHILCAVRVGN